MTSTRRAALLLLALAAPAFAAAPTQPPRLADGSYYAPQNLRWSFANWRRLFPTAGLAPSASPLALPAAPRANLAALPFTPIGGGAGRRAEGVSDGAPMRFDASLERTLTDAIVVLHRGRVVFEATPGIATNRPHIAWSVTKSVTGLLAEKLIAEGRLRDTDLVTTHVPELAGSGFAGATVRHLLDMTTAIGFSERYGDPASAISRYAEAGGFAPRPANYAGPDGIRAYLAAIPAEPGHAHGERMTYRTPNTDALAWVVERAGGAPVSDQMAALWGAAMADPADLHLDPTGTPFAGGGLNASVRDLARFGELVRLGGAIGARRIVPAAAVAAVRTPGDPAKFPAASYPTLPGWSYRSQWWHAPDGTIMARGVHGQAIWIDPRAEVVIARVASNPAAANVPLDPFTLPAFRAVADAVSARR
jgi:hypothetical protein